MFNNHLIQNDYIKREEFESKFLKINTSLDTKFEMKDAKRIWRHFERFAEYDEFNNLYKKLIPEIKNLKTKVHKNDL